MTYETDTETDYSTNAENQGQLIKGERFHHKIIYHLDLASQRHQR